MLLQLLRKIEKFRTIGGGYVPKRVETRPIQNGTNGPMYNLTVHGIWSRVEMVEVFGKFEAFVQGHGDPSAFHALVFESVQVVGLVFALFEIRHYITPIISTIFLQKY